MKVKVFGWFGKGNCGDEAYQLAYQKLWPEFEFDFENGLVLNKEVCFLGGGDILTLDFVKKTDSYKKKFAISVTVKSDVHPEVIARLRKFDGVFVRDVLSSAVLQEHNVAHSLIPDIASCLCPVDKTFRLPVDKFECYERKVGVVLNAHLYHGKEVLARDYVNLQKIMFDLSRLADETGASFIFFPMSISMPWDDRVTNGMVAARCKFWSKNWMVYNELSVVETIDLISQCDAVVSTRLHSSIFSLMSGVPFVDLVHHDKNKGYLSTHGLLDWSVPYWEFDYRELKLKLCDAIYSNELKQKAIEVAECCRLSLQDFQQKISILCSI